MRVWLASWCFLTAWLHWLPYTTGVTTDVTVGACAAAAGLLLVVTTADDGAVPRAFAAATGALALVTAWFVPWEFAAAATVLGIAACACAFAGPRAGRVLSRGLGGAVALVSGGLCSVVLLRLAPHVHEMPALSRLSAWGLAACGVPVEVVEGRVIALQEEGVYDLTPCFERLGVGPVLVLFAAAVPLLASRGRSVVRSTALAAAVSLLYLAVRAVLVDAWILSVGKDPVAWLPRSVAVSFLPLALTLGVLERSRPAREGAATPRTTEEPPASWRPWAAVTAATCAAAALCYGIAHCPAGERKPGRVVIDAAHSEWEWIDQPMTTERYGQDTTYNYSSLFLYLQHYYDVSANSDPLTPERLRDVDVLMLKVPTRRYEPEELDAVERWVEAGGGLFLVGEHTNIFGTADNLNDLAARFGVRFRADAEYDLLNGGLSTYDPVRIGVHAAVAAMPRMLNATGCTLDCDLSADVVFDGIGLRVQRADYSQTSFFAEDEAHRVSPFGVFHRCVGVHRGRGRVLAFTDSTIWSNFFVFVRGKPEFMLGSMEWLNRRDDGPLSHTVLLLCAAALSVAALVSASRLPSHVVRLALVGGALAGGAAGLRASDLATRAAYPLPEPRSAVPVLGFVTESSHWFLPIERLYDTSVPSFLKFFNCAQRTGLVPLAFATLDEALRKSRAVVLINPRGLLDERAGGKLSDFVTSGGRVLLLTTPRYAEEAAAVCRTFGLELRSRGDPGDGSQAPCLVQGDRQVPLATSAAQWRGVRYEVAGAQPVVRCESGPTLLGGVVGDHGGAFFVGAAAGLMSDDALGSADFEPTMAQRELLGVEYELLHRLTARTETGGGGHDRR